MTMTATIRRRLLEMMLVLGFAFPGALFAQAFEIKFPEPGPHAVVIEKDIMVSMRDGVNLATDIYSPKGMLGRLPSIVIRLPYRKDSYIGAIGPAKHFASHGFRVLVQDMRGKWKSEGAYAIFKAERQDGYDFLDWIVQQPWSNGAVGSYGCSYLGESQMLLAAAKHPAHKAMITQASGGTTGSLGGGYRYFGFLEGGAVSLASGFGWFPRAGLKDRDEMPHQIDDISAKLRGLPIIDLMRANGVGPTEWENFVSRDLTDPWWDEQGYIRAQDTFNVPALHVNSWYDYGATETLALFNHMRTHSLSETAAQNQFAIMSPATHCGSEFLGKDAVIGEVNVGDASFPHWEIYLAWFDHWLRGEPNGVTDMPKVQYYVTHSSEWRSAGQWPPVDTARVKFFLRSEGKANTLHGDGVLSREMPGDEPADHFVYDPADPTPSRGGTICCTSNPDDKEGIFDQSEVEKRDDVLVYTSPVLQQPLTLTGPMRGVLHVSSSAKDTDFVLKLVDVWPDGRAYNIQDAILRARYREGFDQKVWMREGEIYRLEIDLHDTAYLLPAGHRLRLEVASSNFPRHDRNLNTGGNNYDEDKWVKASNSVHHNERHPSYIEVTVQ